MCTEHFTLILYHFTLILHAFLCELNKTCYKHCNPWCCLSNIELAKKKKRETSFCMIWKISECFGFVFFFVFFLSNTNVSLFAKNFPFSLLDVLTILVSASIRLMEMAFVLSGGDSSMKYCIGQHNVRAYYRQET